MLTSRIAEKIKDSYGSPSQPAKTWMTLEVRVQLKLGCADMAAFGASYGRSETLTPLLADSGFWPLSCGCPGVGACSGGLLQLIPSDQPIVTELSWSVTQYWMFRNVRALQCWRPGLSKICHDLTETVEVKQIMYYQLSSVQCPCVAAIQQSCRLSAVCTSRYWIHSTPDSTVCQLRHQPWRAH